MPPDALAPRVSGVAAVAVALAAGVTALPVYVWLAGRDLVTGPPWLLALLTPLIVLAGLTPAQRWLGSGRLDNRPVLRLAVAFTLFAAYTWTAGWSLVLPATAILVAVVHIQRSGCWVWVPSVALLAGTTLLGQLGVAAGVVATVVPPAASHVAAAAIFIIAAGGVVTVGLTAAERERVEAELARSDARLRALMESSSDVITVSDATLTLSYVSPAAERATGRSPRELIGTDLLDLVDPEHRARVAAELQRVISGGAGTRGAIDVLVALASQERRWYEWSVHNLLGDPLVEGLVIEQRDVTERLQHQEALAHAASHDDLTGLPNRSGLLERLADDLDRAVPGAGVAVLFLDLDRFKDVNDTHGHAAGDAVLVALSRRLRAALRPHDHLARISGDEFCAILTEVRDQDEVDRVATRLSEACDKPIGLDGGRRVDVGVSIGVALAFGPTAPEPLFARADDDMYRVKRRRRRRGVGPVAQFGGGSLISLEGRPRDVHHDVHSHLRGRPGGHGSDGDEDDGPDAEGDLTARGPGPA
ncbi:sensor domain-containing diguanylate cyclase [Actinotalea sp. M2MS4P-6]|uniref:sensor domain-containing diguanylate cyclase n=1 Tax=Actinotalea sp. M2MS4P-6 TaxID=2983762 RepID=UPI0021E3C5AA|nr:sensor domain-containing diguanylate cyclase [Actinotalea sp. M2MS4P-6]MCV2392883.1 sensor domain-containing diguanylate cyclase [Actinotalea sp. M2MS4P-6]